jgi:hypothetical protein
VCEIDSVTETHVSWVTLVGDRAYRVRVDWKTRRLLPAPGTIPIDWSSGRQALGALEAASRVLENGDLFAIHLEGTRLRDGKLYAGHRGVAHLAPGFGAPIVPAGIVGTGQVQPSGARVPRPFREIVVNFGAPIDPGRYAGLRNHRRRRITDEVMTERFRRSAASSSQSGAAPGPGRLLPGDRRRPAVSGLCARPHPVSPVCCWQPPPR